MSRLEKTPAAVLIALVLGSSAGCTDWSDDRASAASHEAEAPSAQEGTAPAPAPDATPIRDPNGIYFGSVKASGSGCRAGTWVVSISEDGLAFALRFSGYEVDLDPSVAIRSLNCTVNLELVTPPGFSYGITKLYYSGYGSLEEGVTSEQKVYYAYSGWGAPIVEGTGLQSSSHKMVGPYDQDYVFQDDVKTTDINWSACGASRALELRTSITLTNSRPRRNGYTNLAQLDGTATGGAAQRGKPGEIIIDFARRPCSQGT